MCMFIIIIIQIFLILFFPSFSIYCFFSLNTFSVYFTQMSEFCACVISFHQMEKAFYWKTFPSISCSFFFFLLVRNNVQCDKNSFDGYFYDSAIVERKRWKTCQGHDVISFSTSHFQRMRWKSAGLTKQSHSNLRPMTTIL